MAIKDTLSKESLLKAMFGLMVENHDLYDGWYDGPKDKIAFGNITVGQVLKSLWNCTDPIPKKLFDKINRCGTPFQKKTYAAAVQAFYRCISDGCWIAEKTGMRKGAQGGFETK